MSMATIQKQFTIIDEMNAGVAHFIELLPAVPTFKSLRNLWSMTGVTLSLASEAKALLDDFLLESDPQNPLDPDDQIIDGLLTDQRRIRENSNLLDEFYRTAGHLNFIQRPICAWALSHIKKRMTRQYELLGQIRTQIMEHDADCSPIVGSFDNAEDLINALWK